MAAFNELLHAKAVLSLPYLFNIPEMVKNLKNHQNDGIYAEFILGRWITPALQHIVKSHPYIRKLIWATDPEYVGTDGLKSIVQAINFFSEQKSDYLLLMSYPKTMEIDYVWAHDFRIDDVQLMLCKAFLKSGGRIENILHLDPALGVSVVRTEYIEQPQVKGCYIMPLSTAETLKMQDASFKFLEQEVDAVAMPFF